MWPFYLVLWAGCCIHWQFQPVYLEGLACIFRGSDGNYLFQKQPRLPVVFVRRPFQVPKRWIWPFWDQPTKRSSLPKLPGFFCKGNSRSWVNILTHVLVDVSRISRLRKYGRVNYCSLSPFRRTPSSRSAIGTHTWGGQVNPNFEAVPPERWTCFGPISILFSPGEANIAIREEPTCATTLKDTSMEVKLEVKITYQICLKRGYSQLFLKVLYCTAIGLNIFG